MSHQLTNEYWDLLGPNGPFLHELFHNQSQLVQQLQDTNNTLKTQVMDAQDDVSNTVTRAMLAVVQTIIMNIPTGGHLTRSAQVAKPESFDGIRDKTEQFVLSIHIAVMMQLDTFLNERMKILYALSFMHGGMAQVWAANETNSVLANMSAFTTLAELLAGNIQRTFSDPD